MSAGRIKESKRSTLFSNNKKYAWPTKPFASILVIPV
jgi:hypothetical protein